MFQPRQMTTFLMSSLTRARKISLSVPTTAMAIPQASSMRFPGSKPWRALIRRSKGKFFPTIPDDSTGFEDSKVVSGSHDAKYSSQDLTPAIWLRSGRTGRYFLQVLFLAAAYVFSGWLGSLLAVPPGYATAVFPAAGVALAALLLYGAPLAPGACLPPLSAKYLFLC